MSEKIVFVKLDEWLKNFYNLSEEMPLFKKDWESIKEGNLAYDFQSGYQAALEWLDSKDSKNNPDLQEKLKTFVKKWPLMLHLNNLMEQEDLPKAQETLLSLKEVDGRDPSVYFHLGYIQKRLGKTEESINNYHKCIELYPDFLAAYTNLARTYTEIGERDKAVELLRKALEIQPGDVYILEELAALKEVFPVFTQPGNYESLVYIEKKDYQKAIEKEIEKVESPEELFNLANILMQDTLYNSALKAINRYLELEKDNKLNGWLFKAELMRITENLEQTERLLQEIENQFSELPADYYFILAKMQIQQNKISEAIDSLQKLIETDFNHTEGLNLYYFLLKELNRDEDVLEELENIQKDFPESWAALYQLGFHYALNEQLTEAEKYFKQALEINPHFQNILLDLSGIYGKQGKHLEIIQLLEPYFKNDELNFPSPLWNLANAYKITQQFEKALDVYEKILTLPNASPIYIQNAKNEINQLEELI
jgi:tetratricopeptide (TPR) repeat protein